MRIFVSLFCAVALAAACTPPASQEGSGNAQPPQLSELDQTCRDNLLSYYSGEDATARSDRDCTCMKGALTEPDYEFVVRVVEIYSTDESEEVRRYRLESFLRERGELNILSGFEVQHRVQSINEMLESQCPDGNF